VVNRNITNIQSNFLKEGFLLSCENHNITGDLCNCLTIQFNYSTDIQKIPLEKNGMKVSSAFGSTAFVSSLSSRQSPWQSPCSTSNPSSPTADRRLVLEPSPQAALQAPHSLQSCHRRSTFVAPPLDLLLRRHTPGTPLQAPGCEQQAGKAVWSTMHSSPRHSRPLAHKPAPLVSADHSQAPPSSLAHSWQTEAQMVMLTSSPERQVEASSAHGESGAGQGREQTCNASAQTKKRQQYSGGMLV